MTRVRTEILNSNTGVRVKKIMFLGAGEFQIPPIRYAKEQGHFVITCDNQPSNPGHAFSDHYENISTIDREAILNVAREQKIDGIVAYASDVSAPTAAYVGNIMGLPSNPYDAVVTMTRKDLFKAYLKQNGFHVPESYQCDNLEGLIAIFESIPKPVIVKPVDSSGSKGVFKVQRKDQLESAFHSAMSYSICKKVVAEEFLEREGYQVAGDGFLVDGELRFRCFANEHFDKHGNVLVPIGESFPSVLSEETQNKCHDILQSVLSGLGMKMGALNFDFLIDKTGKVYVLEIGPRNGGNLIPEVTRLITGVDMIKYTVDMALGADCSGLQMKETSGYYSSYILHSLEDGVFDGVEYIDGFESHIVESRVSAKLGSTVRRFENAALGVGALILEFGSQEEMVFMMDNAEKFLKVKVR